MQAFYNLSRVEKVISDALAEHQKALDSHLCGGPPVFRRIANALHTAGYLTDEQLAEV